MSYTKTHNVVFPTASRGRFYRTDLATPPYTVTSRTFTATRTRTGDRLANWRHLIATGQDATTTLTGTWDEVEYEPLPVISQRWHDPGNPSVDFVKELKGDTVLTNNIANFDFFSPTVDPSSVDNMARAAFYKKVHALTRKFQGQVFLGELEEALHMLRRPAAGIQDLLKDWLNTAKRRKKANPKKWGKDLADAWLEYAFGWRPLLNDVQDAVKAWHSLTDANRQIPIRVSAGAKKMYDVTGSNGGSGFAVGSQFNNPEDSQLQLLVVWSLAREVITVRYRGAVLPRVKAPLWQDLTLFGFAPEEFIPTVWELLPWSFLVDYFTNIGDLLDATVTNFTYTSYVCKSVVRSAEKHRWLKLNKDYRGGLGSGYKLVSSSDPGLMPHHLKRKTVSRTRQSAVNTPSFEFNFDLSDGQLGNCAALLAQALKLHPQDTSHSWEQDRHRWSDIVNRSPLFRFSQP